MKESKVKGKPSPPPLWSDLPETIRQRLQAEAGDLENAQAGYSVWRGKKVTFGDDVGSEEEILDQAMAFIAVRAERAAKAAAPKLKKVMLKGCSDQREIDVTEKFTLAEDGKVRDRYVATGSHANGMDEYLDVKP